MNFKNLTFLTAAISSISALIPINYEYICADGTTKKANNFVGFCARVDNTTCKSRRMKLNPGSGYVCSFYGTANCGRPFLNAPLNIWLDTSFDIQAVRCTAL